MIIKGYEIVLGLEIHAQLMTQTKAYCADSTEYGALPNTLVSVITLAHPGALPKVNKKVVEYAIKMGLACESEINRYNIYARKNYFYPDLPKGYQISQDKTPICKGGKITVKLKDGTEKTINITRIHMEEDAGKSLHLAGETDTLVDFNRAGVPLIEIVSEPDMRTPEEAGLYITEIRRLVRYLEICDGNMEEGSLRCDVNISVRKQGETKLGTRTEIKNMNSIRNVQRAIEYEAARQVDIIEAGGTIDQETRNFDANTGKTSGMRIKESMNDYRYFPEPDLTPVIISDEWLAKLTAEMPPLPKYLYHKFINEYHLGAYDAGVLTDTKEIALYFEDLCKKTKNYKAASNWIMGSIKSYLNEQTRSIEEFPLSIDTIAELIHLVDSGKISQTVATQNIFPELILSPGRSPLKIAEDLNLIKEDDSELISKIIEEVVSANPAKVEEYKNGKKGIIGMFMGDVMKKSKGKADPKVANQLLTEYLEKM